MRQVITFPFYPTGGRFDSGHPDPLPGSLGKNPLAGAPGVAGSLTGSLEPLSAWAGA